MGGFEFGSRSVWNVKSQSQRKSIELNRVFLVSLPTLLVTPQIILLHTCFLSHNLSPILRPLQPPRVVLLRTLLLTLPRLVMNLPLQILRILLQLIADRQV